MGLAKDSGGGRRVPALSPPASCGATVSRRAEEGQGLASQTWLRHTHTHPRLEEPLAQLTQTASPPVRLSTTASALNGGRFMQKLELTAFSRERPGRPEATRSPAPPLLPCRVPGPPPLNPSNNWRVPSRHPAPCLCSSGPGTRGGSTAQADLRACRGWEVPAGLHWPVGSVSPGGRAGPGGGGLGAWGRPLLRLLTRRSEGHCAGRLLRPGDRRREAGVLTAEPLPGAGAGPRPCPA